MKKLVLGISVLSTLILYSCKGKEKEANSENSTASTEQTTPASNESQPSSTPANEPKTFKVSFSPDTAYLGKNKEAFIRIKNAKAVELQNPDGKSEGTELTFDLDVTNKNKVGGNGFFFTTQNFRLQLDNGNNITETNGDHFSIDAESTKEMAGIKYRIPAGAKPKSLALFHEETRVPLNVTFE